MRLYDLDVTGSITFVDSLETLQLHHKQLASFHFRQIAQNSLRLYLRTLGTLSSRRYGSCAEEAGDFYADFVQINGPSKYSGEAEEWEGVQDKIWLLQQDLAVSSLHYASDTDVGIYWWFD